MSKNFVKTRLKLIDSVSVAWSSAVLCLLYIFQFKALSMQSMPCFCSVWCEKKCTYIAGDFCPYHNYLVLNPIFGKRCLFCRSHYCSGFFLPNEFWELVRYFWFKNKKSFNEIVFGSDSTTYVDTYTRLSHRTNEDLP